MLRWLPFLVGASIVVALAALTALLIVGAGIVDPLLAADRIDAVRWAVVGLGGLAIGCLVASAWLSRGATSGRPD
jgi:hypothetical protein